MADGLDDALIKRSPAGAYEEYLATVDPEYVERRNRQIRLHREIRWLAMVFVLATITLAVVTVRRGMGW